jgi:hypothetical protein
MPIEADILANVKTELVALRANGLTEQEIHNRLESAGFMQEDIDKLVEVPVKERLEQVNLKQDPLELIEDIADFLILAIRKVEQVRGQGVLCNDMRVFHQRCKEQSDIH